MEKKKESILYDDPVYLEPLLPRDVVLNPALELAHDLQAEAARLVGMVQGGAARELSGLLRAMNSYYTNRIEGQHTLPRDIEAAVARNYDANDEIRRKQHLAIAHMQAEQWAESHYANTPWQQLFAPAVVQTLHQQLFTALSPEHLQAAHATEAAQLLVPGQLRTVNQQVRVGKHDAPEAASLPAFLNRFEQAYSGFRSGEQALIALACAHHRLAWIHPFADGNGRAARRVGCTRTTWRPVNTQTPGTPPRCSR